MAIYLKQAKNKYKDEAFNKLMTEKVRHTKKFNLPNIAQEVVKRCSQP